MGGSIRAALLRNKIKLSPNDRKKYESELMRVDELLYRAADAKCVLTDPQTGKPSQFPMMALNQLQQIVTQKDVNNDALSRFEYARFLGIAAKVQHAYFALTQNQGISRFRDIFKQC